MEIPDIQKVLKQKKQEREKEAFKEFPTEFFKSKGSKITFLDMSYDHKHFEVKIRDRKIKVSIFRNEKPYIHEVDGYSFSVYSVPYDDLMFWDIFENEKYKLQKEVPKDFTFEARNHKYVFTYILRYKDDPWETLIYPCDDLYWRIERIQRRESNRITLKDRLQSSFPKGYYTKCFEKHQELNFDVDVYAGDLRYKASFTKEVDRPLILFEQYVDNCHVQKELTTVAKDGDSLDNFILHVQKNLKKFDIIQ